MLSPRAGTILNILVNEYIGTANPVASEDIARLSPTKVSSATVRSAMSQLTDEGYISRPHVSAGGIPSDRGYRHYVESIKQVPDLPANVQQQIHQHFGQTEPDVATWSQRCAAILSRLTTSMAIVTVPQAHWPRLKHIQLVYLEEFLALLIIVLEEARLLRRLLPLEQETNQDQLSQTANKLNEYFSGLNSSEIEVHSPELTPLEERIKRDAVTMLRETESFDTPEHYVDGLRWLLTQPEFSQGSLARGLVEMLEEQVLVESLLSEMPETGDVVVYIGGENREKPLHPYGVILRQYGIPRQASGTICVIGPTRMGYAEAISGVNFLSTFMSQLVAELYGGGPSPSLG
ncbi:MAG: heat-inducible transcriptional repressor HrcA [Dehalococcoidia bacterium]